MYALFPTVVKRLCWKSGYPPNGYVCSESDSLLEDACMVKHDDLLYLVGLAMYWWSCTSASFPPKKVSTGLPRYSLMLDAAITRILHTPQGGLYAPGLDAWLMHAEGLHARDARQLLEHIRPWPHD